MVQTTPAFPPDGCPGRKKTLQRVEQDQARDSLQADEPSPGLVWIIAHAPALLHPSKAGSRSRLAMSLAWECGNSSAALSGQVAAWGHQQSWPELAMQPAACSLHTPGCGLQHPTCRGVPSQAVLTLSAFPGLGHIMSGGHGGVKQSLAEPGPALQAPGMCLCPAPPVPIWGPAWRKEPEPRTQGMGLFCPPSVAAAGLGAGGNTLWIHRGSSTPKQGHVLSAGSAGHEHSYQQQIESIVRAGAAPSSAPVGKTGGAWRAKRPLQPPPGSQQLRAVGAAELKPRVTPCSLGKKDT